MKLYFKTIHEYLNSHLETVNLVHCSGSRYGATICDDASQVKPGELLVMSASEFTGNELLQNVPSDTGLILVGSIEQPLPKCSDLIVVDTSINLADVKASILTLFTKLYDWRESTYNAFYTGSSIQNVLERTLDITENPIYAHDHNYRMFAYAEKRSDNEEWNYDFYSMGRLSPATISKLTNSPGFAETFTTIEPTYFEADPEVEDYNYLYINLRVNNKYAGRLFIDEKVRPITSMDFEVLSVLANIIEIAMSGVNSKLADIPDRTRDILTELASGNPVAEADISYLNQAIRITPDTSFNCVFIDCKQDDAFYNIKLSIGDIIESRIDYSRAIISGQHMAVIIWTDQANLLEYAHKAITSVIKEFGLSAGVSRTRQALDALDKLKEQGRIACQYAEPGQIRHFDGCAFEYILSSVTGQLPAEFVFPESINTLRDYDQVHGTEFIETLRVYLEENQSPSKSCERLYLHRSTFLYRLGRIQEIISDDLTNPDVRLQYMLALKLID